MKVIDGKLKDVKIIETDVYGDHRGFFTESFNMDRFKEHGIDNTFIQDNHSLSVEPGVLRGMHFQVPPKSQAKLIRATTGVIYDVIVDLRKGSPTFMEWEGVILSEYNQRQLFVPKGFAHGFLTLTPNCNVQYKVDEVYSAEHDGGISFKDETLNIIWPVDLEKVILSDKDQRHPLVSDWENPFVWEDK